MIGINIIDLMQAEVKQQFQDLKRALNLTEALKQADNIAKMYERNQEYSYGIFTRIIKAISQSSDKQDRRAGIILLSVLAPKMQGTARSIFVNKFHSPVFKMLQNNQEQQLIKHIANAYCGLMQIGGNHNDSAIQSNLSTVLAMLEGTSGKEVRKIGAYAVMEILVSTSPYVTFKKLLQKQRNSNLDNLSLAISASRVKSIKVRQAYLQFLTEYVKYIAEKKDAIFQKATFERFYQNYSSLSPRDSNQELNHLYIQTMSIFLVHLGNSILIQRLRNILEYTLQKINNNKNPLISKSLIQLIPRLVKRRPSDQIISSFLKFLKGVEEDLRGLAQTAINQILETLPNKQEYFNSIYKDIVTQMQVKMRRIVKQEQPQKGMQVAAVLIKTLLIMFTKTKRQEQNLISAEHLQQFMSCAMLVRLDQQVVNLLTDIAKDDLHKLGRSLQIKFILIISKILTGSARKVIREVTAQFKQFIQLLQNKDSAGFLEHQENKVRAIEAVSHFRVRQEFREVVGGFVKDRILKYYLQWGNPRMKMASVYSAFFLYAKKGRHIATSQLMQMLARLLRVGLTDSNQAVRQKVFKSIARNFKRHQQFIGFFTQVSLLSYLFQAMQDRNEQIRLWSLRIVCTLYTRTPSVLITPYLKQYTFKCFYHLGANFKYYNHKQYLIQSLVVIIQCAPSIILQQLDGLLTLILQCLQDRNNYQGLQLLFFDLVKTLSYSLPESLQPYAHHFSQHLVQAMSDKLNFKNRTVALKTLICIIKNCGYVVIPYFQIPTLRQTLAFLIRSEIEQESRTDIVRIIGALGAVDNLRYSILAAYQQDSHQSSNLQNTLKKLNCQSNFLQVRSQLLKKKADSEVEKKLKIYIDELMLLQNAKGFTPQKQQLPLSIKQQTRRVGLRPLIHQDTTSSFHMTILQALFQIMADKSLSQKYLLTVDVLSQLLQMMGGQLQKQLAYIVQTLLGLVDTNEQILNCLFILGHKCDISCFVGDILSYLLHASANTQLVVKILTLLTEKYCLLLRPMVEEIIDKLHQIVAKHSNNSQLMVQVSYIYHNISAYLQPYLSIVIPQLLSTFFQQSNQTTKVFVDFIMSMAKTCPSLLQFMPVITHRYAQLLSQTSPKMQDASTKIQDILALKDKICNCIVLFITVYKRQFISYLPLLHRAILTNQQPHQLYLKTVRYLQYCSMGNIQAVFSQQELQRLTPVYQPNPLRKFDMPKYLKRIQGIEQLVSEFDPLGKKIIDQDWIEWLKKTAILLLKKSPNVLLRTCSVLADQYNQLGLELYNISFHQFWEILIDQQKKILIDNIKRILTLNPKPLLIVRKTFLNLAQFMSRKKCAFQLSSSLLAQCAAQSFSFAKKLFYRQQQFQANPQKTVQGLINTYMRLGQPQNAKGLFKIAASLDIKCKTEWYIMVGSYDQAYKQYRQSADQLPSLQKLKCLSHISDQKFIKEYQKIAQNNKILSSQMTFMALQAHAHLQQWQQCEKTFNKLQQQTKPESQKSLNHQFWSSIISVKTQQYQEALTHISNARQSLYQEIPDIINFSSTSEAFEKFVTMQQLFELQEIVGLRQSEQRLKEIVILGEKEADRQRVDQFQSKRKKLKAIWSDRLIGCSRDSRTYCSLQLIRSLLLDHTQNFDFYYQLCQIYIKERKISRCQQLINKIKTQLQGNNMQRQLTLLHLLQIKINFTDNLVTQLSSVNKIQLFLEQQAQLDPRRISQLYYLSAMALYQQPNKQPTVQHKILQLLKNAAQLNQAAKQWYIFSIINMQFAQNANPQSASSYTLNALVALLNSLKIASSDHQFELQGYLKLLSLLCNHSKDKTVFQTFIQGSKGVAIEGWINVVPQMIAQLFQNSQLEQTNFIKILKLLLKQLGKHHPQSVLFSLNFAAKSRIDERVRPALQIIQYIKQTHHQLAVQVQTISSQLGRTAIKLKEYWFDGIQGAWSSYNQTKNSEQAVITLKQICQNVMNRKSSNSQIAFHQQFGLQIRQGYQWLLLFEQNSNLTCLAQVFQIFYGVYKRIKDSFDNVKKVYLKNVAPFLVASHKYKSTIPGTYAPGSRNVKISGFGNELIILQSKQRPRKLTVYGDDQKEYNFLLKGREDLRLDQRVMQFFSLVNRLLKVQRQNLRRDLSITRYSIIPLTVNTGLIGWVQGCDTLNQLIKEYRSINKIRTYVQKQLYQKMSPDFAFLPVINKLQIFKNGIQETQGKDLQRILWFKSPNSQVWLQKRNNYTASLATMSMVGYILGLGDRHPSNIMLQRDSGKVVHIDFGDCFQVAVLREKFPQKVPFRLTRMLQKAMGVPGIYGLFRVTCEMVMKILRENKESLYGVLQTFAQDPIISWRLTKEKVQAKAQPKAFQKENINEKQEEKQSNIMMDQIMNELQSELLSKQTQMEDSQQKQMQIEQERKQIINEKAVNALLRVKQKLHGTDFGDKQLKVTEQVNKLILEATSAVNICQSWPGWCPFW